MIPPAVADAVAEAGRKILADAAPLVPIGDGPSAGRLKASATAAPVQINGHSIAIQVGFNTEYAAIQHERLDFIRDQGQAKFLEAPLRANQPTVPATIAASLRRAL